MIQRVESFVNYKKKTVGKYNPFVYDICYFRELLKDDPYLYVPEVIHDVTTKNVLTTELASGVPVDKLQGASQEVLNEVSRFRVKKKANLKCDM